MFILPRRTINYFPAINYLQHSRTINYHYMRRDGGNNIDRLRLGHLSAAASDIVGKALPVLCYKEQMAIK